MKRPFSEWRIVIPIGIVFSVMSFLFFVCLKTLKVHKTLRDNSLWWSYIIPILIFMVGGILEVSFRRIKSLSNSLYEGFSIGMVGFAVYYILIIGDAFLWRQIPLSYESLFIFIGGAIMAIPLVIGGVIGGFLGYLITRTKHTKS
ncbi:MAG TPA: hypothetical protein ENI51_02500 [Candidatus Atribacteria bacterium]|nr:hypothetical protein [Candidatus Atribacteria bacterium]